MRLFINAAFGSVTFRLGVSPHRSDVWKCLSSEYTILLIDGRLNYVTECIPLHFLLTVSNEVVSSTLTPYLQCDIMLLAEQSLITSLLTVWYEVVSSTITPYLQCDIMLLAEQSLLTYSVI